MFRWILAVDIKIGGAKSKKWEIEEIRKGRAQCLVQRATVAKQTKQKALSAQQALSGQNRMR